MSPLCSVDADAMTDATVDHLRSSIAGTSSPDVEATGTTAPIQVKSLW